MKLLCKYKHKALSQTYQGGPAKPSGPNLLATPSHFPCTITGRKGEKSLTKDFPRRGIAKATLRTRQSFWELFSPLTGSFLRFPCSWVSGSL